VGASDLTRSSDRGLGVCIWAHLAEYLSRVHSFYWILEVFGGHTCNGCHRWTIAVDTPCDEDAGFGK